jgi:hypothetical protein
LERLWRKLGTLPAWLLTLAAVVLAIGVLTPQLHTSMRGDDSHVQIDVDGQRAVSGNSLVSEIGDAIDNTINVNGRPQPFGVVEGLTYAAVFDERVPYKLGIAALAFGTVLALWAFLQMYGVPRSTLLILSAAFALSLQFRAGHDPVTGYYSTPQVIMLVFFAGLATYLRFLRGGGRRWYVATLVLVVLLLGLYEANYPLVLAFAALHAGADSRRLRRWPWMLPILAMGAFMTLLSAYLHSHVETPPTGYETSLDVIAIVLTAAREAVSGLPNIYFLAGSGGLLPKPTKAELLAAFWRAGLAALLVLVAFASTRSALARHEKDDGHDENVGDERDMVGVANGAVPIALVGVVLMAGSGLLIALATQWQQQIGLGGGHLATFSCTMGFVMLVCAAWIQWAPVLAQHRSMAIGAAIVVFGMAFAGQYSNMRVVSVERPGVEQRDLFRAGLDRGILKGTPAGRTVFVSNRDLAGGFGNLLFYGGTIDYLVLLRTGLRLDVRPYAPPGPSCGRPPGFPINDCSAPTDQVDFLAPRALPHGGVVILAEGLPRDKVDLRGAGRITVLARGVSADGAIPLLVGNRPGGRPWSSRQASWTKDTLSDGWARYRTQIAGNRGPLAQTINDPRSKVDFIAPGPPDQMVRLFGTKNLLP